LSLSFQDFAVGDVANLTPLAALQIKVVSTLELNDLFKGRITRAKITLAKSNNSGMVILFYGIPKFIAKPNWLKIV
jgi:hypothetical protein